MLETSTCVKTGAHVYMADYDAWVYGDMHQLGNVFILRACAFHYRQQGPLRENRHYTAEHTGFFPDQVVPGKSVTVLFNALFVTDHGCEGVPEADLEPTKS